MSGDRNALPSAGPREVNAHGTSYSDPTIHGLVSDRSKYNHSDASAFLVEPIRVLFNLQRGRRLKRRAAREPKIPMGADAAYRGRYGSAAGRPEVFSGPRVR